MCIAGGKSTKFLESNQSLCLSVSLSLSIYIYNMKPLKCLYPVVLKLHYYECILKQKSEMCTKILQKCLIYNVIGKTENNQNKN